LGAETIGHLRRAAIFADQEARSYERQVRPAIAGLAPRVSFGVTHEKRRDEGLGFQGRGRENNIIDE
jgi:hypothetical protein